MKGEAGLATASGMAAIHGAILSFVSSGDEVIIPAAVYGGTVGLFHEVMPRLGISHRQVRSGDTAAVVEAIGPNAAHLAGDDREPDHRDARHRGHRRGRPPARGPGGGRQHLRLPYLCNPLSLGADLVVHSVTKYIGGHSDLIGGAVIGSVDRIAAARRSSSIRAETRTRSRHSSPCGASARWPCGWTDTPTTAWRWQARLRAAPGSSACCTPGSRRIRSTTWPLGASAMGELAA